MATASRSGRWDPSPSARRTTDSAPSAPTSTPARTVPSTVTPSASATRVRTVDRRNSAPAARAAASSRASNTSRGTTDDGRCVSRSTTAPPGERSESRGTGGYPEVTAAGSTPRPARTSSASGATPSPHTLSRGKSARSSTSTEAPLRRAASAAADPAGPPPTTTTSQRCTLRPPAGARRERASGGGRGVLPPLAGRVLVALDEGEQLVGVGDHAQRVQPAAVEVAVVHHAAQLGQQRLPEPVDVHQDGRLGVQAEHAPGPGLEQLLQRAGRAGQRDEGVGELGHAGLALVHGGDHLQPRQPGVRELVVHQVLGDDADDVAAGVQGGVGDHAHQSGAPAAVDDADARAGEPGGEPGNGGSVGRRPALGPGEDGDAHDVEPVTAAPAPPAGVTGGGFSPTDGWGA